MTTSTNSAAANLNNARRFQEGKEVKKWDIKVKFKIENGVTTVLGTPIRKASPSEDGVFHASFLVGKLHAVGGMGLVRQLQALVGPSDVLTSAVVNLLLRPSYGGRKAPKRVTSRGKISP